MPSYPDIRTATAFDVHRFGEGDSITLCGVTIPFHRCLVGHSDADVALHALTDALFGALGDGDIGTHFPPSDPQWQGMDSMHFLHHALTLMKSRGGILNHADITIICEEPHIGAWRAAMVTQLEQALGLSASHIGLKATTSEGLGFTGRKEGIAALAQVTLIFPSDEP